MVYLGDSSLLLSSGLGDDLLLCELGGARGSCEAVSCDLWTVRMVWIELDDEVKKKKQGMALNWSSTKTRARQWY